MCFVFSNDDMTGADPRFADFEGLELLLKALTLTGPDGVVEIIVEVVDEALAYGGEYIFLTFTNLGKKQ